MRKENKILNFEQVIKSDQDIALEIRQMFQNIGNVNSAVVYGEYDDYRNLKGFRIKYNVSQCEDYNTIRCERFVRYVINELGKLSPGDEKYVICYMQPPLDMLVKLYKPLVIKLAKEIHQYWQYLDMEDLIAMCNLVICDLYYKGYYVHKSLIRTSYINYVLMHIRKDKRKPTMISLDQEYSKTDDDDKVTVADMIADTSMVDELEDKYDCEVNSRVLQEVKEIVIDFIGQRQYDQLLREYGNKSTTAWSRKLMTTIKAHLFEMGINVKSFSKYYN